MDNIAKHVKSISENKKSKWTGYRLSEAENKTIEDLAYYYNTTKSEIIRLAIITLTNKTEIEKNNNN